jgi:histidinol phosphatase-like enzyme (inositol monophosphatase family)
MIELDKALEVACAATEQARRIIRDGFTQELRVETKADASPVTEIDCNAEQAIRSVLRAAYPTHGIYGEEFGWENRGAELAWLVDPIDGTASFINGLPFAATLIALCRNDEPLVAVLDLPILERRATAIAGQGAWEGQRRLSVRRDFDPARSIVVHGDFYTFRLAQREELCQRLLAEVKYLRGFTDAYGHYLVASGAAAVMVDPDLAPWDAAAPSLIVAEAGGRVERIPDPGNPEQVTLVSGAPEAVEWVLGQMG